MVLHVELTQAIVLALTSVLKTTTPTTCTIRNVWLTLVLLAFFVSVVRWKPFNSRLYQLVASAMTFTLFLAVLLMSVTLLMDGSPESVAKVFLGGSGFLLFALSLKRGVSVDELTCAQRQLSPTAEGEDSFAHSLLRSWQQQHCAASD